jgi:hypothetical protein
MKPAIVAALAFAIAAPPTAHAAMFKCTGRDGKVSFQGTPCDSAAASETIKPAVTTSTPPPKPTDQTKKELEAVDKRLNRRIADQDRDRERADAARDRFLASCEGLHDDIKRQQAWLGSVSQAVVANAKASIEIDYRKLREQQCPGYERGR